MLGAVSVRVRTRGHRVKAARVTPGLGALLLIALAMIASACYDSATGETEVYGIANFTLPAFPGSGAHAVEMFNEMHYQPWHKSQEGPRLLPPPGSVPVSGKELAYTSLEEYQVLSVPDAVLEAYDEAAAQELYTINCQVCHGLGLKGDGQVRNFMTRGPFPADLTIDITRSATDGALFGFITDGGRQGQAAVLRGRRTASPMPEFGLLLTEGERWMLVMYLRSKQGLR